MRATVLGIGLWVLVFSLAEAGELRVVQQATISPPVGLPIVRDILALDDRGVIVVGDGFVAPAGPGRVITEIFVIRLDANGVVMWSTAWGSPEAGPFGAVASGAALAPGGDILVAGQTFFDEPAKGFVLRVTQAGQVVTAIDIGDPNTDVDDVAVDGPRVHVAARQLVSFDLTTPTVTHITEITATETSNGDLVALPTGDLFFAATTEAGLSRDFTLSRFREGGAAAQVTIGGSADDQLWALAVTTDETRAYVVGRTLGLGANEADSDFPYVHPLRPFGGGADATLVAFQGTAVVTATSWGGNALDSAYDVAVTPSGAVLVVGETESTDFPIVEPLQPDGTQGRSYGSWFDSDLTTVLHSTRLGLDMTQAQSVAFDKDGRAVIAGRGASGMTMVWIEELVDSFRTFGGNNWWVEVYFVDGTFPLDHVEAQVSGGPWRLLTHQTWGSWAASFFVPPSSAVRFRAVSSEGATLTSRSYLWPSGTVIPLGAAFAASFIDPRGNNWWIETDVGANQPIALVEARIGKGSWFALPLTSWGSYATSRFVLPHLKVQFRVTSEGGATVYSDVMAWPP